MKGTVKWFSSDKGYGFITSHEDKDHYFNVQSITGASLPDNGDSVEFKPTKGDKGAKAINVVIVKKAPKSAQQPTRADDRITCPSCDRKIVPRIIMDHGSIDRTVCPFCTATIEDHSFMGMIFDLIGFLIKLIYNIAKNNPIIFGLSALVLFIILAFS